MNTIEPISGNPLPIQTLYGQGVNPFVLNLYAATSHAAASAESSTGGSETESIEGEKVTAGASSSSPAALKPTDEKSINLQKITTNSDYLYTTLFEMLQRGRYFFNQGMYTYAAQEYLLYFRYLHMNRLQHIDYGVQRFAATFEAAWTMQLTGDEKKINAFLNTELSNLLTPEHLQEGLLPQVKTQYANFIQHLQQEGLLPGAGNMTMNVTSATLEKMTKFLISHGLREQAESVAAHLQARQLLQLYKTEQLIQRVDPHRAHPGGWGLILFPFSYLGVPMAPVLPNLPEKLKERESKKPKEFYYYTDTVEPVYALNQDPNETTVRKKREQKRLNALRRGRRQKPGTSGAPAEEDDEGFNSESDAPPGDSNSHERPKK